MRKGILATLLITALLLGSASPAGANHLRSCGDTVEAGAGAYDVRASKNVRCKQARRVATRFFPGGERKFNKWRCRQTKSLGIETAKAKCTRFGGKRRKQTVKFVYGA